MIVKEEQSCSSNSKKPTKKHIKKKMANTKEKKSCPLCTDHLDLDDLYFFPCECYYQVCRFCWHKLKTENCSCPNCRRPYPDDPANYRPLSQEEIQRSKAEKRLKDKQKKKEVLENRNQLANKRILQKNLVYIQGLPSGIENDNKKLMSILLTYGPCLRCIINNKTNYAGSQTQRATAYVTYQKVEDALKACKNLPQHTLDGHTLKASLGTTKYCSNYLKNTICSKKDCMYLHEVADEELCFTKEQIQASEHVKYADILYERMLAAHVAQRVTKSSPIKETACEIKKSEVIQACSSPTIVNLNELSITSEEDNVCALLEQSKFHHLFSSNSDSRSVDQESDASNQTHSPNLNQKTSSDSRQSSPVDDRNPVGGSEISQNASSNSEEHNRVSHILDLLQNGLSFKSSHHVDVEERRHSSNIGQSKSSPIYPESNYSESIYSESIYSESNSHESPYQPSDDDLDFDPCQISLEILKAMVDQENNMSPVAEGNFKKNTATFSYQFPASFAGQLQQKAKPSLPFKQEIRIRNQDQEMKLRTPPPGFNSSNEYHSVQQVSSPIFDSRTTHSNKVHLPAVSSVNPSPSTRSSCRYSNLPSANNQLNNSSIANGFAPQSVPTISHQLAHNLMSQSSPNIQLVQAQRSDQVPMTQYQPFDLHSISYAHWNYTDPTLWYPPKSYAQSVHELHGNPHLPNTFRNNNLVRDSDVNLLPASTLVRYPVAPFSENSPAMFPGQLNLSKGVHTYP